MLVKLRYYSQEIVAALNSECNIVPVMDEFKWPAPDALPEDMKSITRFNGIRYILSGIFLTDLSTSNSLVLSNQMSEVERNHDVDYRLMAKEKTTFV